MILIVDGSNIHILFDYSTILLILFYMIILTIFASMANKKLQKILKQKGLSVYGLTKALDITPQAAEYIVKKKPLEVDYVRLQKIADYVGCEIEEMLDLKK